MKVKIVKEMLPCDVSLVAMLTMYLGKGGCNRWCQNTGIAKISLTPPPPNPGRQRQKLVKISLKLA